MMFGKSFVSNLKVVVYCLSRCKESIRLCSRRFTETSQAVSVPTESLRRPPRFNNFPFSYHEVVEVKIEDICNLGSGVGKYTLKDGKLWTIFVPNVLPGEICKVRIYRNSTSYSESDLVEVLQPSEVRIIPKCKYYADCGGCQYQHIPLLKQRELKKKQVVDVLSRIGKLDMSLFTVNDVLGTDHDYGYRTKITPQCKFRKEEKIVNIGFQRRGTHSTVDIDFCAIATSAINEAYRDVRIAKKEQYMEISREFDQMEAKFVTSNDNSPNLNPNPPVKFTPSGRRIKASAGAGKNKLPRLLRNGESLIFRDQGGDRDVVIFHKDLVQQTVNGLEFEYKAGEFFQNNSFVLPLLVDYVLHNAKGCADNYPCNFLIDAYCGSGLFSICGAKHFKKVIGIEVSELAVKYATLNSLRNNLNNTDFILGTSSAVFNDIVTSGVDHLSSRNNKSNNKTFKTNASPAAIKATEDRFDIDETVVIIDPPRSGCDKVFLDQLFAFNPKKIVYVSCDPATQARDADIIVKARNYRILNCTPFDLFPQTRHIENVITFVRD